jgi:hypothetical protein
MEIRHRQQLGLARRQPRLGGRPLTLRAVPVAAGVIGDARVRAVLAAFDMTALRWSYSQILVTEGIRRQRLELAI